MTFIILLRNRLLVCIGGFVLGYAPVYRLNIMLFDTGLFVRVAVSVSVFPESTDKEFGESESKGAAACTTETEIIPNKSMKNAFPDNGFFFINSPAEMTLPAQPYPSFALLPVA